MKKEYEVPDAEAIRVDLEDGIMGGVYGGGDDPIIDD